MSKRRTVDHPTLTEGPVGAATPMARLLYVGVLTLADDYGNLVWNAAELAELLYPHSDRTPTEIGGDMNELVTLGTVRCYTSPTRPATIFGHVTDWDTQTVRRPSAPRVPLENTVRHHDTDPATTPVKTLRNDLVSTLEIGPETALKNTLRSTLKTSLQTPHITPSLEGVQELSAQPLEAVLKGSDESRNEALGEAETGLPTPSDKASNDAETAFFCDFAMLACPNSLHPNELGQANNIGMQCICSEDSLGCNDKTLQAPKQPLTCENRLCSDCNDKTLQCNEPSLGCNELGQANNIGMQCICIANSCRKGKERNRERKGRVPASRACGASAAQRAHASEAGPRPAAPTAETKNRKNDETKTSPENVAPTVLSEPAFSHPKTEANKTPKNQAETSPENRPENVTRTQPENQGPNPATNDDHDTTTVSDDVRHDNKTQTCPPATDMLQASTADTEPDPTITVTSEEQAMQSPDDQASLFAVPDDMLKHEDPKPVKKTDAIKERAHTLLRPWWTTYGNGWPQTYPVALGVIVSCMKNGMSDDDLKRALTNLGNQRRPLSGGTIGFALSKSDAQVREEKAIQTMKSYHDASFYTHEL